MERFDDGSFFKFDEKNRTISFRLSEDELDAVLDLQTVRPMQRAALQQALNVLLGNDLQIISARYEVLINQLRGVETEMHDNIPTVYKIDDRCKNIYKAIFDSEDGLTDDETQVVLERTMELKPETLKNSIRYPRGILAKAGLVRKSGERRPTSRGSTANVWIVTDPTINLEKLPEEVEARG